MGEVLGTAYHSVNEQQRILISLEAKEGKICRTVWD
jgi:anti-sigma regulatory factor (Ser/Thr protein kinase)